MKITNIIILFLLATASPVYAGLNVITTTEDLASIAESIGGKHIKVESLTPGTRDPHYAQAKPSMIRKLAKADLVIVVGADMEIGWLPKLIQSSRNRNVLAGNEGYLDLSKHVNLLGIPTGEISRAMGDVHAKGNPHYWLNPANGLLMAEAIRDKLSQLDSRNKAAYQRNYETFTHNLQAKLADWRERLKHLSGSVVITYHTSLLYLANAFDLKIVDHVEPKPGISPSAAHINHLIKTINAKNISMLIMEPYYERRSADLLKQKTGIRIVVIPQSVGATEQATDYLALFDEISRILVQN